MLKNIIKCYQILYNTAYIHRFTTFSWRVHNYRGNPRANVSCRDVRNPSSLAPALPGQIHVPGGAGEPETTCTRSLQGTCWICSLATRSAVSSTGDSGMASMFHGLGCSALALIKCLQTVMLARQRQHCPS